MKLILLSLLVTVYTMRLDPVVIEKWEGQVEPYLDACVAIADVDWNIAKNMFRNVHLPDEGSFHCYIKCLYDKLSFLNSNQELNEDVMMEKVYALTPDLLQLCVSESGPIEDICLKTYNMTRCIIKDIAD
ncbi:hypothetical protein PPYR_09304 [Photinus pyralis]|uniref:Uncharacterized protein n=2 Tax=Photinus pyralis TaxID=7054 RepID=A0A5N4ALX6_PHOPY|nr:hypothetical protein PPYR_09304 [Photinus pyralis]